MKKIPPNFSIEMNTRPNNGECMTTPTKEKFEDNLSLIQLNTLNFFYKLLEFFNNGNKKSTNHW